MIAPQTAWGRTGLCARQWGDLLATYRKYCRAHIAVFVRELTSRPSRRGANVVSIDSGAGLSNATIQQRLVAVRLFSDHLIDEGLRESNPGRAWSSCPPDERQWRLVLAVHRDLPWGMRALAQVRLHTRLPRRREMSGC
ncbi:hypothetical protein GCM10010411_28170 [Actinomadura fulvescens]|uniref:Integrase n=1 Tax=Actinomadura fulvescens TaxID=46160 RepID=A0ABP6BZ77_9ACTN